ncbi:MAG TPA: ATP-dependent DNA ligase [Myxococcaceae bacterium]|nr:ATP-dependent DNA ligase [Myxococcaceae bacterium]
MSLPVQPPVSPMLSKLVRELPPAGEVIYEPKWDGFRTIVFREGEGVELGSRNERPMTRYFPELLGPLRASLPDRCVVDGEIVIAGPRGLDFDALLNRIHPAASRVRKLAEETPASFVAFDLLAIGDEDLRSLPFEQRRRRLEQALAGARPPVHLTPATRDRAVAEEWFRRFEGAGLDGVMVKPLALPYLEDKREMLKVKHERTADCAVAGFRWFKGGGGVGSFLLGLNDEKGTLHHVGICSGFSAAQRKQFEAELAPLREGSLEGHPWKEWATLAGESGQRMPGAPSRWNNNKDLSWEPVRIERVVEVSYDHLQGPRFRHATHFLRWRPDRTPDSCTYGQLEAVVPAELTALFGT